MKGRKLQIVLYVLVILFCVGFYIYEIKINNVDPQENLGKFIIIILGAIIGILRKGVNYRRSSLAFCERSYANDIKSAFSDDKKLRTNLLRALRYYNENKSGKAEKLFKNLKSQCKRPDDYLAVGTFLGNVYIDEYRYAEALNEYQEILDRLIGVESTYNNLGYIYANMGKKDKAIEYYERCISLFPNYEAAYINIADIYFDNNELDVAIKYATQALEINSKAKQAAGLLAKAYAILGDKEKEDKYFHLAVANGTSPELLAATIRRYVAETRRDENDEL